MPAAKVSRPTAPRTGIRSRTGLCGSLILPIGVAAALASAITLNAYGSEIIHCALGASFALLALSAFDFRLPRWVQWSGALSVMALAIIFLAQALADIVHSPEIGAFAYATTGQVTERLLGDLFLAWCVLILAFDSTGRARWLGVVVVAVALGVEATFYVSAMAGIAAEDALKLLYLPLFVWLALESSKPRSAMSS